MKKHSHFQSLGNKPDILERTRVRRSAAMQNAGALATIPHSPEESESQPRSSNISCPELDPTRPRLEDHVGLRSQGSSGAGRDSRSRVESPKWPLERTKSSPESFRTNFSLRPKPCIYSDPDSWTTHPDPIPRTRSIAEQRRRKRPQCRLYG